MPLKLLILVSPSCVNGPSQLLGPCGDMQTLSLVGNPEAPRSVPGNIWKGFKMFQTNHEAQIAHHCTLGANRAAMQLGTNLPTQKL